jgi:hypothetical protein
MLSFPERSHVRILKFERTVTFLPAFSPSTAAAACHTPPPLPPPPRKECCIDLFCRAAKMGELLYSRCDVCRKTDWQCGKCAKEDKQKRKAARMSAGAVKQCQKRIDDFDRLTHSSIQVIPDSIANLNSNEISMILHSPNPVSGSGSGSGQSSLMSPDSAVGFTESSIQTVDKLVNFLTSQAEKRATAEAVHILKPSAPPPPDPDQELDHLIRKHKLFDFWRCVNVKLHVETVAELAMIAKSLLDKAAPLQEFPAAVK